MGLLKNAILGPIIIYWLLMGHVIYNTFLRTPGAVSVQEWPKDTKPEARDAIIASRKPIIKEIFGLLEGTADVKQFLDKRYVSFLCPRFFRYW